MGARVFDRSELLNRYLSEGSVRAPRDGFAMGLQDLTAAPVSREITAASIEFTMRGDCGSAELGGRCMRWKLRPNDYGSGVSRKYTEIVESARGGAVMHPGFAGETHVYADL